MICTQLDGDILKPQFMEQLAYLKERSKSSVEREKCDRLAACLLMSSAFKDTNHSRARDKTPSRPKTSMATLDGNMWNPYETSMNREYPYRDGLPAQSFRPKTSNAYRNPYRLCDPIGMSIYTDEFCWKPYSKPDLIRTATASGARSHKPNPDKDATFITWRLPREKIPLDTHSLRLNLPTAEDMQRTMRAQYCSTYKEDYLGLPQGYQVKYAINPPPNWKREIPRPLDTESRFNYQIQPHAPELQDFTHKYGCYSHLQVPSKGAVPTVISSHIRNQENKKQLTTYQRHFGKEYVNLSAVINSLDPGELKVYLRKVPGEERRGLERVLNSVSDSKSHPIESKMYQTKSKEP